jgi:YebC/PmpR family DNA-binding regulatory protein
MDKGLAANMPKDTIERAIKRGSGDQEGEAYEEVRYEGYGAGGTAVLVDCMTDNRNRTASEVRHAFSKCGGNLGTDGSVAYMFNKLGVLTYAPGTDEDAVMAAALEAGAEDVVTAEDGSVEVLTTPEAYGEVKTAMSAAGLEPESGEVTWRADVASELDVDDAQKVLRLIDMLEDLDDVQEVYTNAEISDDVLEAAGAG